MWRQIKYSGRIFLKQRLIALGVVGFSSLAFCLACVSYGYSTIVYLFLSGLAMIALYCVNIAADVVSIRALFGAPEGYLPFLTPVPRRRILLGRLIPIAVLDLGSLALCAALMMIQMALLADSTAIVRFFRAPRISPYAFVAGALQYIVLILLAFFVVALCKSLFFRRRAKTFLGIMSAAVILYLFNILNLVLGVACPVTKYGVFYTVTVTVGLNAGTLLHLLLLLLKGAGLFFGTAALMERRVNV